MQPELELSVGEFVALLNQTLEYAYPSVVITGELANFRVSKNRWVYFDLKDETSSVKFFGTVYNLPGPLEDGMLLRVRGQPRLHNLYGFSVTIMNIQPAGEGSIRKAADLLAAKLAAEGLFEPARKRALPYPPTRIGLITSKQSAAYADFTKIINARWSGLEIELIDVQVQGEVAPSQIVAAIEHFNRDGDLPDVLVLIRGGGSAEDLAAFSTEQVTRAVAASRVPTMVAIGHEIDLSLAELAADVRASTPSNAAELLVPDKQTLRADLKDAYNELSRLGEARLRNAQTVLGETAAELQEAVLHVVHDRQRIIQSHTQLLTALNPAAILRRGYAIVRQEGRAVRTTKSLRGGGIVEIELADGRTNATIGTGK